VFTTSRDLPSFLPSQLYRLRFGTCAYTGAEFTDPRAKRKTKGAISAFFFRPRHSNASVSAKLVSESTLLRDNARYERVEAVDKKVEGGASPRRSAKEKRAKGWRREVLIKGCMSTGRGEGDERARDEERNSYCLASPAFPQYTAQVYRMCALLPLLFPRPPWRVETPLARMVSAVSCILKTTQPPTLFPPLGRLASFGKMNRIASIFTSA